MSEQRLRKTEATRSFDRLPLNALRVFEAVAARLSFVRNITGSEAAFCLSAPLVVRPC
jgi:hypothetical protein